MFKLLFQSVRQGQEWDRDILGSDYGRGGLENRLTRCIDVSQWQRHMKHIEMYATFCGTYYCRAFIVMLILQCNIWCVVGKCFTCINHLLLKTILLGTQSFSYVYDEEAKV